MIHQLLLFILLFTEMLNNVVFPSSSVSVTVPSPESLLVTVLPLAETALPSDADDASST